ncbi:uncharacterized protein LOC117650966 [Thrips palmi]|uniref:Uncharacterized protein LOC117650966 n=1 Tax=Thrips palmi TaxID=161013 RepID=A0A6P8ZYL4_THRPL|nr:uncharacterized protein LOC117650966 [Thrips palmi]
MSVKVFTFCFAFAAVCYLSQVQAGRLPPGLPKPKSSSVLTAAKQQALLQGCVRRVVKGKEKTVQGQNFVLCFRDTYMALKVKPALPTILKDMNQCTRPGGFNSKSALYTSLENCVLSLVG